MSTTVNKKRVVAILTQATSFPYTHNSVCTGISIINTGDANMVVTANGLTIPVPQNTSYDGDIGRFTSVNVTTTSSAFAIELRG